MKGRVSCRFEWFWLLAGQGGCVVGIGQLTCYQHNRAMPDAAVAVWRLDPVRAHQDRPTSASAHGCSVGTFRLQIPLCAKPHEFALKKIRQTLPKKTVHQIHL